MLDASRQTVSTHLPLEEKKPVYVNDWERSRKELLIAHSLCVMSAIVCNWQCGLTVEAFYSTVNLPNPAYLFVFILHLFAYSFLHWQWYVMETKYDKGVNKWSVVIFKLTGALKWKFLLWMIHMYIFHLCIHHLSLFF